MTESNASGPTKDLSEMAFEIAKRRQEAASEVVTLLEDQFESTFESHAGSLLRAAGWLAGTSLYRSFGFAGDIPAGAPVLSDKSNDEGMKLLKVFMYLLDKNGIALKAGDFAEEIPAEQKPRRSILQVQQQFEERYDQIMRAHGFDQAEGARTGAVACALLVKLHCLNRSDLEARLAASIVTMGFVEGTKTAPWKDKG